MGYDPSDFPYISQLQRSAVTVTIAYSDSSGNPRLAFRIVYECAVRVTVAFSDTSANPQGVAVTADL